MVLTLKIRPCVYPYGVMEYMLLNVGDFEFLIDFINQDVNKYKETPYP